MLSSNPSWTSNQSWSLSNEAIFVGYEDNRIGWRVCDLAGKHHFSRDIVFNENTLGHLSPTCGTLINHALLPPPSLIPASLPTPHTLNLSNAPHTTPNPLPSPTLTNVLHNCDAIARITHYTMNSLPKPIHHYNDIDPITLFISLNAAHNILPPNPNTPDPSTTYTTLYNECFLSSPLLFLWNWSWDLSKPPNSYYKATNRPDSSVWLAAMQHEYDSLELRKAFNRITLPPGYRHEGSRRDMA